MNKKKPKVVAGTPVTATPKAESKPVKFLENRVLMPSRYIPRKVKDEVRIRDHERCTYVSPDGKRCDERVGLQFDHCEPFSLGGKSVSENLCLRCFGHNQLYAEQVYGKDFIDRRRLRK